MINRGMVRRLDDLGHIVLPIELRRNMEIDKGTLMEIFFDDANERLFLRKYRTEECIFCFSSERVIYFRERFVCGNCLNELTYHLSPVDSR